jgi:exodeoxyribonuclease VII large subunit
MESLTLLQLTQRVKDLFVGIREQWISAEIAEVNYSGGHCYLTLVQKAERGDKILARVKANIWSTTVWALQTKTQGELNNLLQIGNKVLLKVALNFHDIYGFSLTVSTIDATYTVGELELRRLRTLAVLTEEGLHEKQKKLHLKPVIQRIAVISSVEAAGYEDFMVQLEQNQFGYQFEISFFHSAVQGEKAEAELVSRLEEIGEIADEFDVALLMRGGGSRLDLEVFNSETIARTIAIMSVPVLTGIGHTKDQSVADFVSFESLKTPTALADFILTHNNEFELNCLDAFHTIIQQSKQQVQIANLQLTELKSRLANNTNQILRQNEQFVVRMMDKIGFLAQQKLSKDKNILANIEKSIDLMNPKNILQRGYTMTLLNGKLVNAATKFNKGDKLKTKGFQFEVESEVK